MYKKLSPGELDDLYNELTDKEKAKLPEIYGNVINMWIEKFENYLYHAAELDFYHEDSDKIYRYILVMEEISSIILPDLAIMNADTYKLIIDAKTKDKKLLYSTISKRAEVYRHVHQPLSINQKRLDSIRNGTTREDEDNFDHKILNNVTCYCRENFNEDLEGDWNTPCECPGCELCHENTCKNCNYNRLKDKTCNCKTCIQKLRLKKLKNFLEELYPEDINALINRAKANQ